MIWAQISSDLALGVHSVKSLMPHEISGITGGSEGLAAAGKALSTSFPQESPNTTSGSALGLSSVESSWCFTFWCFYLAFHYFHLTREKKKQRSSEGWGSVLRLRKDFSVASGLWISELKILKIPILLHFHQCQCFEKGKGRWRWRREWKRRKS